MKRTVALIGLLVVGLLLLFDPDTGIVTATADQTTRTSVETPTSSTTSTSTTTSTTEAAPTTSEGSFTVLGEPITSPFGAFRVQVVVEDGLLVDIVTVDEPQDRRSQRINDYAIPIYEEEAISAQSSDFDVISGATVTWEAWGASLESALFEAGV
jgi:uncharacterized protein with FMN-binding domain